MTRRGRSRRGAFGPEILGEPLSRKSDHAIGGRQDRLRRAVVAVEGDDLRAGAEVIGEIQDVADRGGAKRIDRLGVVADDGEAATIRLQREQDRRLKPVGVLIFVDHDMIEAAADLLRDSRLGHHLRPLQQQIVVIEDVLLLLGLDVAGEQLLQFVRPSRTPGKVLAEHLLDRRFARSRNGNRSQDRCPWWKTALGLGESELVPHQVEQIRRILAIMDGEGRIEADLSAYSRSSRAPMP